MARAKTEPPRTVMAIVNATQGMATMTRAPVELRFRGPRVPYGAPGRAPCGARRRAVLTAAWPRDPRHDQRRGSPPRTEPSLPGPVFGQRALELLTVEVRPEPIREIELGVSRLPEQEVRESLLSAGPDHELRVFH